MQKQKAIELSYGEYYNRISPYIDSDGWFSLDWKDNEMENIVTQIWDNCDKLQTKIRPKSLKGIENNNGWVKIESEDDLPKDENIIDYWVLDDNEIVFAKFMYDSKTWWHNLDLNLRLFPTHYQKIQIPPKPIY